MGFLEDRLNLAGKTAVIVGGGGGLGRAIADDFAGAGMSLALCDRNAELLEASAAAARAAGVEVVTLLGDGREPDTLEELFRLSDERFDGRCDVLVNVVGGTFRQPFAESTPSGWNALIRTNFTWLLTSTHLAVQRMLEAGSGSIMSLTSIEGHRAAPGFAVYSGMKAAVVNFTRTLAIELAPHQIRVNTIAADMVPTEGSAVLEDRAGTGVLKSEQIADLSAQIAIPMGRRGRYEDVGGCALFLASDLSTYVTGCSMHPDGGALASSGWFNWPDTGFLNVPPAGVVQSMLDQRGS
jgi:3-oxoacyl-[acyl-carrier protein] reductase